MYGGTVRSVILINMKRIINRLVQSILIIFFVSIICFLLVKSAPGDPVLTYVQPNMSESYIAQIREELGLTKPLYQQYFIWLHNILGGNFGYSLVNNRPVLPQILERLPATILLMGTSLILSVIIATPLGLFTGRHKNKFTDKIISFFSYIGISIPTFWFAIILIYMFSVHLKLLPSIGMHSESDRSFSDMIRHLVLPCIVITFSNVAVFTRYIRSSTITELSSDYVMVQTAYGMSEFTILFKHVLKNAMLPIITILGMSLQNIVSGAIISETVFAWPGMGQLAVNSVTTFDYPLIMAITLFTAILIVLGNLLADLLYSVVDPRIKSIG